MSENHDDITKAFAGLKPEDLIQTGPHFLEHTPGPEAFRDFIGRHLYSTRYAYMAADGAINPVAALSDGRVERLFTANDGETLYDMVDRLHGLAASTGSTRFFFSRLVPTTVVEAGTPQLQDDEAEWTKSLAWYSQDTVEGAVSIGSMPALSATTLGQPEMFGTFGGDLGARLSAVLGSH